jgi:Asp-tRNA(Asn)/Glu-tRNA(Gln) amidotransferase A subunit family amidase
LASSPGAGLLADAYGFSTAANRHPHNRTRHVSVLEGSPWRDAWLRSAAGLAVDRSGMKAMPGRATPEAQGRVTQERLVPGALVTGPHYLQAQRLRRRLTQEVDALFAMWMPFAAPPPMAPRQRWRMTGGGARPADHRGLQRHRPPRAVPARGRRRQRHAAVPADHIGRAFAEAEVPRLGHAHEQATEWHTCRPPEIRA